MTLIDQRPLPDNQSFSEFTDQDTDRANLACYFCDISNAHEHPSSPSHPPRLAIGRWDGRLVCYEHAWVFDREPHPQVMTINNESAPLALWPWY